MAQQTFTPLSNMEVSAFCSQMAMILHSGIFVMEGISIMLEDTLEPEEHALLVQVDRTLQETGILHEALRKTGAFPEYMLQMIRIGEETGKLDDVLTALSAYYDREASIAQTIKNAVTYPLIMVFMMLLVILVLVTKVMPIFDQIFRQLGNEMTGFSRAVLNLGTAINRYSAILIVFVILLAGAALYFGKSRSGRRQFRSFAIHISFIRSFMEKLAACRFANGMSLTLSSGMSPEECLKLTSKLVAEENFSKKLDACQEAIENGQELSEAFTKAGIFTGLYARMASIGDRTGALDEVMQEIADRYQEEIDLKFTGIIGALEPTLVIILSLIVGMILLSVMLPLMGIMSSL
ncbi:MAG: type II secretion system F family protein [Lachnospiraceae bacterium]|nr:type II secretion system F family protein [Lachnospiraceae bacterium]